MKLQIVSDLHLEFFRSAQHVHTAWSGIPPAPGADALVLAGDIGCYELKKRNDTSFERFRDWPVPVVYVAGNHEYYKSWDMGKTLKALRADCHELGIHFLEQNAMVLPGHKDVRFLGSCMWTDYLLFGRAKQPFAMLECGEQLNDHRQIRSQGRSFMPKDAMYRHVSSKNWLREQLVAPFDGKTVVITHHGCGMGSVADRWKDDLVSAGFSSDLTQLVQKTDLWIHGHTHDSHRYQIGKCDVVVNPRGYPLRAGGYENEDFDPLLVVEV